MNYIAQTITSDRLQMQDINKIRLTLGKVIATLLITFISFAVFGQEAKTYDEAIIYGDKLLKESRLMDSKAYYQQALKLKPADEYARAQIQIIINRMQSAMSAEDEYYDIIDVADELYDQNKVGAAILKYKEALKILPNDEYALEKIREIEDFQNRERERIDSFNKAMEAGKVLLADLKFDEAIEQFKTAAEIFPENGTPITELSKARSQKEEYLARESRFNEKFEEAERYLLIKKYAESLELFKEAQKIMPEKRETQAKIDQLIPLADKAATYNRLIETADEYYIDQDFISAQKEYTAAAELWPEKSYPGDMILKITEKLEGQKQDLDNNFDRYVFSGDSLMNLNEYALAKGKYNLALNLKPDESYPKNKINEIDAIFEEEQKAFEENYNNLITSADDAFNSKSYNQAKALYQQALEIKPDDSHPKGRLTEIDELIALAAAQNALEAKYAETIAQADNLFSSGNFEMSAAKYKEAQEIKPDETYAPSRIAEINLLMAEAEELRQINNQYNALITRAGEQLDQNQLEESKKTYEEAAKLKPGESLPNEKIAAIDILIADRERAAELKKQYDNLVAEGDSLKNLKEYDAALVSYNSALSLIPSEQIALVRKNEVESIQENIRREAERRKSYEEAVAKGDNLFEEESFELAKVQFEIAQNLYSDEDYPVQRLSDIRKELVRLAAEREERYKNSIADGDIFFDQADYDNALKKYQIANSIKPDESYPVQRITECEKYITERKALLLEEYKVAIAEAEKFYNGKIYDKAILSFRKAQAILPNEPYPTDKINEITKFIEENSIVDIVNSIDTLSLGATERFTFEPVKINVRKSNYIFIKAKNLSDNETKLICSYGSEGSKNGGFVVQVVEGDEYNDYIVRVGNQYKWFSEDNNWISIVPENGDVEIRMLRISKGY